MAVRDLILREGDIVRASGLVMILVDSAWFEPALPEPTVAHVGPDPVPTPSPLGVPARGFRADALGRARTHTSVVTGLVTLSGSWSNEALIVQTQEPLVLGKKSVRHGPKLANGPAGQAEGAVAAARPVDLDLGEALARRSSEWLLLGFQPSPRSVATDAIEITVARVTEAFASWADGLPPGVLAVQAWLTPQRIEEGRTL